MTDRFIIDDRRWDDATGSYYYMIYPDFTLITAEEYYEIETWCKDPKNGKFDTYYTGIEYYREQDLLMFILRWA